MASTLKIILTVGGIFLTGTVTGGFVGFRVANHYAAPKHPQSRSELPPFFGRMAEQLKLTPEQKERIQPVLTNASLELKRLRSDVISRTAELVATTDKKISEWLTPEQREQLHEIRARDERRRQMLTEYPKAKVSHANPAPGEKVDRPNKP
jgi:Spy/CpxP family protein refolding chaperone